jgi:DNA polymerase-4
LKIKYHNFKTITRRFSSPDPTNDFETIYMTAKKLLDGTELEEKRVRLLGITMSNFRLEVNNSWQDQLTLGL